MKTSIRAAALAAALSIGAVAVAAAPPSSGATPKTVPPRTLTVTQTYVAPTYTDNESVVGVLHIGGGQFAVPTWANYYSIAVTDASGLPTAGYVEQETRNDDRFSIVGDFCGQSSHSFPVDTTVIQAVWVTLDQGPCTDGTLAAGTTGTISVTFTS